MSKLAKKPVAIKEGVSITFEGDIIKATGSKGNLIFQIPEGVAVKVDEGNLTVSLKDKNNVTLKPELGLTRAMIANMVKGVSIGFEEKLELSGVGYRAQVAGKDLTLSVGFSHPVKITATDGLSFTVAENIITVAGIDKEKVGNMAKLGWITFCIDQVINEWCIRCVLATWIMSDIRGDQSIDGV